MILAASRLSSSLPALICKLDADDIEHLLAHIHVAPEEWEVVLSDVPSQHAQQSPLATRQSRIFQRWGEDAILELASLATAAGCGKADLCHYGCGLARPDQAGGCGSHMAFSRLAPLL